MQVLSSSLFVCVRAWKRAHSTLITPNFHTVILFFDLVHSCNVCMLRAYFSFIVVSRTVDNTEWGFFSSLLSWVPVLCLQRELCLCALRPLVTPNILGIIFKLETKGVFDFSHICSLMLITHVQRRNIFDFNILRKVTR